MTYVTAAGRDPAPFRLAIGQAITALSAADADLLHLHGFVTLPGSDYDLPLADPPRFAA